MLGRKDEARHAVMQVLSINPTLTTNFIDPGEIMPVGARRRIRHGLTLAGLPEGQPDLEVFSVLKGPAKDLKRPLGPTSTHRSHASGGQTNALTHR